MNDTYFQSEGLMKPPTNRAAYSDRTAWLMADLCRLAYFPFEGGNKLSSLKDDVFRLIGNDVKFKEQLGILIDKATSGRVVSREEAETSFWGILEPHGFEGVGVFSENDTQGFVAVRGNCAFLIYRGTESLGDVMDDINCLLVPADKHDESVLVHKGFYAQFNAADAAVQKYLSHDKVRGKQLFIGGHSLGGALANLATRFYAEDSTGATYTFGAPSVAPPEFQHPIKTPIYRLVNQRDPVPLLPNPMLMHASGFLLSLLVRIVGTVNIQKELNRRIKDAGKMRQIGYAGRIVPGRSGPEVRNSFGIYDGLMLWFRGVKSKLFTRKKSKEKWFFEYHFIDNYEKALRQWGERRQNL